MLELMNTSASTVQLGKNVKIGNWESLEHREDVVEGKVHANCKDNNVYSVSETDVKKTAPPELKRVILGKLEHLVKTEREVLGPVILKYCDPFLYDHSGMLPCTNKGFHEIKTGDALPIKMNPYKVHFALGAEMKKQLDEMIQQGVITPSCSEWAAPVILVKKKSMDGTPKYWFCTDFRGLNAVTKYQFILSRI
jgi:hypothetical protein